MACEEQDLQEKNNVPHETKFDHIFVKVNICSNLKLFLREGLSLTEILIKVHKSTEIAVAIRRVNLLLVFGLSWPVEVCKEK